MQHTEAINTLRRQKGYLTIDETLALAERGNLVLDPFSVLISASVIIGADNIFYPNVIVEADEQSSVQIGDGNIFYPQTILLAVLGGVISIEDHNQFGDNGCSIKANVPGSQITVGSNGRYLNGCQVMGKTALGSGSQLLGSITVQDCTLKAGESYAHSDPDERAGLLKGSGLARGITVHKGEVLAGTGTFQQEKVERQSAYHPKK